MKIYSKHGFHTGIKVSKQKIKHQVVKQMKPMAHY